MQFSFKIFILLAFSTVLIGSGESWAAFSCRDALAQIHADVLKINAKTVGGIEALRFVELPAPVLKAQLITNLYKDPYIKSRLSPDEISSLADSIMDGKNVRRSVLKVIGRFFFFKDHPATDVFPGDVKSDGHKTVRSEDARSSGTARLAAPLAEAIKGFQAGDILTVSFSFADGYDAYDAVSKLSAALVKAGIKDEKINAMVLESYPPQPSVSVTIDSIADAKILASIVDGNSLQVIKGATLVGKTSKPASALPSSIAQAKNYLDKEWGHFSEPQRKGILEFLEKSVLADPLFQQNPTQYVRQWRKMRGYLENLITPNDQALSFLEGLAEQNQLQNFANQVKTDGIKSSDSKNFISAKWVQNSQGGGVAVRDTAKTYLDKEWSHFSETDRQGILIFIEKSVLADPQFQQNPRKFLRQWQEQRGGLEMLITPDDQAQAFLEDLAKTGQLDAFAERVKKERLSGDPKDFISSKWAQGSQNTVKDVAKKYFDKEWGHFDEKSRQGMVEFLVQSVFPDPLFQQNPVEFIRQWMTARGGLQMLITPDDPALRFLRVIYTDGTLTDFVKNVRDANFQKQDGVQVLSEKWAAKASAPSPQVAAKLGEYAVKFSQYKEGQVLQVSLITKSYTAETAHTVYDDVGRVAQLFFAAGFPEEQVQAGALESFPPQASISITIKTMKQKDAFLKILDTSKDINGIRIY